MAHIVSVLRGGSNDKIEQQGHDRLDVYGGRSFAQIRRNGKASSRQMVAAGFLEIDVAGYGGIKMTAAGMALTRGDGEFRYRADRIVKTSARKRRASAEVENLDSAGNELLAVLKAKRLRLAEERGVPAYVISQTGPLADMAAKRPATREEFAGTFGVGEAKLKDFADIFIDLIASN